MNGQIRNNRRKVDVVNLISTFLRFLKKYTTPTAAHNNNPCRYALKIRNNVSVMILQFDIIFVINEHYSEFHVLNCKSLIES